ncbi:PC-esterase domain-containing protein 1A [Caerostris darwini]|uniref:PC-esterase domain-containing protein 1A n=1 Tax=Caerostris darwini TaxID=1538125 RepID=A0AAV4SG22_9ARAC|nr:PC-esterase domain-containing protein 1A [Caerostris darwini]
MASGTPQSIGIPLCESIKKEKKDFKMFDIFLTEDMHKLMYKKRVVFMGDSNIRALYKDFLCLKQNSKYIPERTLQKKMENTVFNDKLVFHGLRTNGRCYREEREAHFKKMQLYFFFLTKVYDEYVESILKRIRNKLKPDVIIINSCLWDVTRWGCNGVEEYKYNLKYLFKEFKRTLPDCLIIWVTTPPISSEMKGGFLVKELQFLKYSLRFHILEANNYARKVVVENGFDLLDSHYYMQMQIHRRTNDGIHWKPEAVRYVTNLLLTHISLSFDFPLPHRYKRTTMRDELILGTEDADALKSEIQENENDGKIEKTSFISKPSEKLQSPVVVQETKSKKRKKSRRRPKHETIHGFMSREQNEIRRRHIRQWHQHRSALLDSPIQNETGHMYQHHSGDYLLSSNHSFVPNLDHNSPVRNVYYNDECDASSYNTALLDSPIQFNHQTFQSNRIPHLPYEDVVYDFENFDFDGTQNDAVFGRSRSNFGNYNNECYSMTRPRVSRLQNRRARRVVLNSVL